MIVWRKYEQGNGQETASNDPAQLDGVLPGVVQVAVPSEVAVLLVADAEEGAVIGLARISSPNRAPEKAAIPKPACQHLWYQDGDEKHCLYCGMVRYRKEKV